MDDLTPVFNYLGEDILQQRLVELTTSFQGCFPVGSDQFNNLAKYNKKLVRKLERWPEKIKTLWQNRTVPVYSPESITKCNQAHSSRVDFANESRKRLQTRLLSDINRLKKKIDDIYRKRDNSEEKYNEQSLSSTAMIQLLNPNDLIERVRISTTLRSSYDSYIWTVQRLANQEKALRTLNRLVMAWIFPIRISCSLCLCLSIVHFRSASSSISWIFLLAANFASEAVSSPLAISSLASFLISSVFASAVTLILNASLQTSFAEFLLSLASLSISSLWLWLIRNIRGTKQVSDH